MSTNAHTVKDEEAPECTISSRLKDERARLDLSQTAFAKLAGVQRRTQAYYEAGERLPDADYLAAIARAGADVGYVLTGERVGDRRQALWNALDALLVELEISKGYEDEWRSALQLIETDLKGSSRDRNYFGEAAVRALLKKSPVLMLDTRLLADVIEKLEFVLDAKGARLSPSQKASAVLCLFREAKTLGLHLDYKAVEAIVSPLR